MEQTQSHGFSFLPPMKYSEVSGTRPVLGGGCGDEGSRLGLKKPIKDLTLSFGPGSRPWKPLEASLPGTLFCPESFCVSGLRVVPCTWKISP